MADSVEYIDGMKACRSGKPCPVDASDEFVRGYGVQYELEQIAEHNPGVVYNE